jgi:integrase
VSARTLSAFVTGLRGLKVYGKVGMQASTISVRLQFLHGVLRWAVEQGFLTKLPAFPDVRVPNRKPKPVPAEPVEKLLDKAPDDHLRAFPLSAWRNGLRLAEAIRLEREETEEAPWVEFARNRIWFPAAFVKATEDQWVPLDPELREALLALPSNGCRFFRFQGPRGQLLQDNTVAARVSRLSRQAGVKLTMRVPRRGFGCRWAARVPAQILQRMMRHASITTTMDYYANIDDALEAAMFGQRNSSRNTPTPEAFPAGTEDEPESTRTEADNGSREDFTRGDVGAPAGGTADEP